MRVKKRKELTNDEKKKGKRRRRKWKTVVNLCGVLRMKIRTHK